MRHIADHFISEERRTSKQAATAFFFFSVRDAIVAYSGVKCFIQRQSKGEGARDGLLAAKPLPYFNSAADVEEGRGAGARRAAAV